MSNPFADIIQGPLSAEKVAASHLGLRDFSFRACEEESGGMRSSMLDSFGREVRI
jgi:hypothetical protein